MTARGNWRDFVSVNDYLTATGLTKRVYWNNGKLIGECVQDVDGFWKYAFMSASMGLWDAYVFEILAEMLNELNSDWEQEIKDYFG